MLSACGGGGGHGGHIPNTTLPNIPENPGTDTNTCSTNPETCMATAKISTDVVNQYLSQQVESAEKETSMASYSLKSRARVKAVSSDETMESRIKSAYGKMKEVLIDAVSYDENGDIVVKTTASDADLKKSLLLAGYSVSDLDGVDNLNDWVDTNALFETTKPRKGRLNATELVKHKQNKALEQIDSKNEQIANNNSHELQISHKKQEVRPKNLTSVQSGWGGWIRTNECRHQKPMPYHLATPQQCILW